MQITRGIIESAQKVVIYGPEGIGKTTFASKFPNPVFIDTEGSTKHMNVARLPNPSSWTMLLEEVKYVKENPNVCDTLVVDTADWAERLCIEELCAKAKKTGIEDWGYGKGYVYLMEEFGRLLNALTEVVSLDINVVLTAHAQMRKFEQPDEMGAYDRWEMKLQRKTAPMVKEWADMVLFANYKTYVVNVDDQGAVKGKNKAQGGKRVMYTTHHPCWDAKSRFHLLPELPLDYDEIKQLIPSRSQGFGQKQSQPKSQPPKPQPESQPESQPPEELETLINDEIPSTIPVALADLMKQNNVTVQEIQWAVATKANKGKGVYPIDTPIENYDPGFIKGVLVGAWDQMFKFIREKREDDIPF